MISLFSDMITEDMQTDEKYLSPDRVHLGQFAYPEVIEVLKSIGIIWINRLSGGFEKLFYHAFIANVAVG